MEHDIHKQYIIIEYDKPLGIKVVGVMTAWLNENVGEDDFYWDWPVRRITLPKNESASMFRLKFGI